MFKRILMVAAILLCAGLANAADYSCQSNQYRPQQRYTQQYNRSRSYSNELNSFNRQIFGQTGRQRVVVIGGRVFRIGELDNGFADVPRQLLILDEVDIQNDFYFNNIQLFKLYKYPTPDGEFLGEY